jgi:hypothetical protein
MADTLEVAHQIYQSAGQDGVIEWAIAEGLDTWAWCVPCEYDSPMSEGTCLVCWTVREDN